MEDEIEGLVTEDPQVAHVAELGPKCESFSIRNRAILIELSLWIVEDRDIGSRGGEHGALLTTSGREAQHIRSAQRCRKPIARNRLMANQDDRPVALPRASNDVRRHRSRPLVARVDLLVPSRAVVRDRIDIGGHAGTYLLDHLMKA